MARISLATKYRFLFGLAVLLIIGAALAVPWVMLEALVLEQPFREARAVADNYFRGVMPNPEGATGVHGGSANLLGEQAAYTTRFLPIDPNPEPPTSQPGEPIDSFLNEARLTFRDHPNKRFYYQTAKTDQGRRFRYAHAVWVTRSCLDCHAEGRSARPYRENQLAGMITVDVPAEQSGQSAMINRILMATAGALAGILAILVFYLITTRFILSPIHELRSVAVRVADGDLAVRSTVRTGDEFEQLAVNINTMLERLRDSQDELKKANLLLDEKLGEMAESNVALYEANRVKSEFLANVSHELRTPLTSIIGFAELLREGSPDDESSRSHRYAENILISGRILLEIINDLLDLAKIEAGKVELRIETVQLREVCATLVDFMQPQAEKKRISLAAQIDDELPVLSTDHGRLRQILFNLVSNAIKFTPDGGRVRVVAQPLGEDHVRVSVEDTGPGVPPEQQEIIFEKFRQVDQSATRKHQGTGLGLAIAKELTQLLGGRIGVESASGEGAVFWLELPMTAPEAGDRPLISLT